MKTVFLLDKEDIGTFTIGDHFVIRTKDGTEINFTQEALIELCDDLGFNPFNKTNKFNAGTYIKKVNKVMKSRISKTF